MKKLILAALVASLVSLTIQAAPIFTMDFESSEGYTVGNILNQNGWKGIYFSGTSAEITTNSPQHGTQCFKYTDANAYTEFDISTLCEETDKLLFKGYFKYNTSGTKKDGDFRLQSVGTSGKHWDYEIFQMTFKEDTSNPGTGKGTIYGSQNMNFSGLDMDVYHEFTVLIDPANQKILGWSIDSTSKSYDGNYYRSKSSKADLGKIPDSFRIMNSAIVDNLTIEVVPEPAIFGLLALVGLFLRRK